MSAPACNVLIGSEGSDHIRLTIFEANDEDWRRVQIDATFAPFAGSFNCQAMTHEFIAFRDQLKALYATLKGEARLCALEGNIDLVFKGDGRGGVNLTGALKPDFGLGTSWLTVGKGFDQTDLSPIIASLEQLPASKTPFRSFATYVGDGVAVVLGGK